MCDTFGGGGGGGCAGDVVNTASTRTEEDVGCQMVVAGADDTDRELHQRRILDANGVDGGVEMLTGGCAGAADLMTAAAAASVVVGTHFGAHKRTSCAHTHGGGVCGIVHGTAWCGGDDRVTSIIAAAAAVAATNTVGADVTRIRPDIGHDNVVADVDEVDTAIESVRRVQGMVAADIVVNDAAVARHNRHRHHHHHRHQPPNECSSTTTNNGVLPFPFSGRVPDRFSLLPLAPSRGLAIHSMRVAP